LEQRESGPPWPGGPAATRLLSSLITRRPHLTNRSTKLLVDALNNSWQTRIGDPWKGTYHLSIQAEDMEEAETLAEQLRGIGIEPKINLKLDEAGNPKRFFVSLYAWESLKALLDALGDQLDEPRHKKLATLVRARGPVHPTVVEQIHFLRTFLHKSDEAIASELNRRRWASGMRGKGWTAKKIRKIRLAHASPYTKMRTAGAE
jgi:hypothetical protein